ncbi:uncharacterized protein C7orf50 homolog [Pollicipes pollicipes]|uniref:uncharacterized protein C7orf50 homolog n=1 Tax=Pollicipes pollicipes TaxID=41117 RepID=UPI001884FA70|nr:uncharacterized protein C7orf50 homolog [Pollicipes pollicipes]XP_037081438.1 uncharacterized protein C7orf50 homolog [Pollicipes pollicipes]
MGEKAESAKRRKIAHDTSAEADTSLPVVSKSISEQLLKNQSNAQKEKQKKIKEANKLMKREKRKQRVKKEKLNAHKEVAVSSTKKTSPEYAVAYVQQWKEDKDNWKFQKLVQAWILQNLLDDTKISREDFPLVMEYAASVRGAARRRLSDELLAVVEARDRWPSLRAEGQSREQACEALGRAKPSKRAYRRASRLLQSMGDDEE